MVSKFSTLGWSEKVTLLFWSVFLYKVVVEELEELDVLEKSCVSVLPRLGSLFFSEPAPAGL